MGNIGVVQLGPGAFETATTLDTESAINWVVMRVKELTGVTPEVTQVGSHVHLIGHDETPVHGVVLGRNEAVTL